MSDVSRWYAVQTRSNLEQIVVGELNAKGIANFCPCFSELHQWADRKKIIERPVFPGYVLSNFIADPSIRLRVRQSRGVVRILGTGNLIEAIPDVQVESIQRMLSSGEVCFSHPFLCEGAKVRVRRGPLKDLVGTLIRIKHQTRLVLSVDLISNSVATEVDLSDIEELTYNYRPMPSLCA